MIQHFIFYFIVASAIFNYNIGKSILPKESIFKSVAKEMNDGKSTSCDTLGNSKHSSCLAHTLNDLTMANLVKHPFARVIIMKTC